MSDDHSMAHGHADDGAVHAHIAPVKFYIAIFLALCTLTVATVAQSYLDLGSLNLVAVILIASMKASLVILFFMHLKYDNRLHGVFFVCGIMFIGVFFAYTMNDTDHRGEFDKASGVRVWVDNGQQAPGGFDEKAAAEKREKMVKEAEAEEHKGAPETAKPTAPPAPEHH